MLSETSVTFTVEDREMREQHERAVANQRRLVAVYTKLHSDQNESAQLSRVPGGGGGVREEEGWHGEVRSCLPPLSQGLEAVGIAHRVDGREVVHEREFLLQWPGRDVHAFENGAQHLGQPKKGSLCGP